MVNKVLLIGHLGKDPEIKHSNNGKFAVFSVATSERWKDKDTGERKERSEWHNIVVYPEGLVKVCEERLKKGSKVYIEGQNHTRKWTDDKNITRYQTDVVVKSRGKLLSLDKSEGSGYQSPPDDAYEEESTY